MNYRHSPHLAQWALHDRLAGILLDTIRELDAAGMPRRVLEVGAGHGAFAPLALAAGCDVTVVEMSRPALADLRSRYGANDRLRAVADPQAGLDDAGEGFALAVSISVLHHVPDYLALLDRLATLIRPGGAIVLMQEPLWYPRVGTTTRAVDRGAYLAWRLAQGNIAEGFAAMRRRLRHEYPSAEPGAIVYHHVVRRGVDEDAVARRLRERFARVETLRYWSHHLPASRLAARIGGLANTFVIRARGRAG